MSLMNPKNLESDFSNLNIDPSRKRQINSQNCESSCKFSKDAFFKKKYSFRNILVTHNCNCKILRKKKQKSLVVRPAKLNLPATGKTNMKLLLLKPPLLNVIENKSVIDTAPKSTTPHQNTIPNVSNTTEKVFNNDKLHSYSSFKSIHSNEDNEILKAFDMLSFKELRTYPLMSQKSSKAITIVNKRDNNCNNSCSVQAKMESSVPVDCDDTSIEELACYFDLFVHIPKKMSSMAEMMYI